MELEYFILFLPLLAAFISGFLGQFIGHRSSEIITSLFTSVSAILSILIFYKVVGQSYENNIIISTWLNSGSLNLTGQLKLMPYPQ